MAYVEKLPTGFERLPSEAIRVRVRLTGLAPVTRTFPLFSDTADARREQIAEAKAWVETTRRDCLSGSIVSNKAAQTTKLADVLETFQLKALKGKPENTQVEGYRIKRILADPIAQLPLARLRKADLAAFRDRLIEQGWAKRIASARKKASKAGTSERVALLDELSRKRAERAKVAEVQPSAAATRRIAEIEQHLGLSPPARTTIVNVMQLIGRALKMAGETIDGIPDVKGVSMPSASNGRERRLLDGEEVKLLSAAAKIDPRFPLLIQFAIRTALRRERILEFSKDCIREVGKGRKSIVFPIDKRVRNKRTGTVPLTKVLLDLIEHAELLNPLAQTKPAPKLFGVGKRQLTSWWNRLTRSCAIEDLHWHDLRHEATSRLFESGLNMIEVMSITGHATTEMLDRYSHYNSAVVGEKQESGDDTTSLLRHIRFLKDQYVALGGDPALIAV